MKVLPRHEFIELQGQSWSVVDRTKTPCGALEMERDIRVHVYVATWLEVALEAVESLSR